MMFEPAAVLWCTRFSDSQRLPRALLQWLRTDGAESDTLDPEVSISYYIPGSGSRAAGCRLLSEEGEARELISGSFEPDSFEVTWVARLLTLQAEKPQRLRPKTDQPSPKRHTVPNEE